MPVLEEDISEVQESRASRLSRSLKPPKDENGWTLGNIGTLLFGGPILLAIAVGWIVIIVANVWFFGNGFWETLSTGTMPTDLLQFFKGLIGYGTSIGAFVGLAFIWKGDPKGLEKFGAIVATIILVVGVFTIINWTHTGRGAVEYSDD